VSGPIANHLRANGKNVGVARARDIGIRKSTGEYLAFLDDDDVRSPGSIDKQIEILTDNPKLGFVYGQVQIGDWKNCVPTGEVRPRFCPTGDIFWQLLKGNFIYISSVLVRRRHFASVGMSFDCNLTGAEDWDAWIRIAESYPVGVLQEPVAIYRDFTPSSGQISSNRPKMGQSSARTLDKALHSRRAMAMDASERRRVRTAYMNTLWTNLVREGSRALSDGLVFYAATNFITALQLNPKRAARPRAIASFVRNVARSLR
jgi:glycosyltransferase involved in cell wall biosynthesis